jgi:DNA polymerase-4
MDAFYVGVEVRRDPSLAGKAVVVGGTGQRGVVAAASYEARAYGVHSAMSSAQARRLCPSAVFLPGDYAAYEAASREVHDIFGSVTPLVEGIALDEAFLDVTGARRLLGTGAEIAAVVRRRVADELALACSVGVAPNKFLAKLASVAAKPHANPSGVKPGRGIVVVGPGEELAFLHPHPVRALWGVGPATLARLQRLGVATVGDLAALSEATVVAALGVAIGRHLHALAHGNDERPVEPDRTPKSIGHEQTFPRDLHDEAALAIEAVRMSEAVATRLRAHHLVGRTVTLKVRFADFTTITRATTLPAAVDGPLPIAAAARALLAAVDIAAGVRLLGVTVSNLTVDAPRQLRLDEASSVDDATSAVDDVRRRFGATAIGPASLVGPGGLSLVRRGLQQWGPNDPMTTAAEGANRDDGP